MPRLPPRTITRLSLPSCRTVGTAAREDQRMIGLSRDSNHRYTAAYDGTTVALPSVTTILQVLSKPALVPWAQGIVAEAAIAHRGDIEGWIAVGGTEGAVGLLRKAAETQRDKAATRGSDVHALAEKIIHGESVIVPDDLTNYVDGYRRWVDVFKPEFLASEELIAGDGYAGTLDAIAVIAGETWLLDWKTSKAGPYKETACQLAAYGQAHYIGRPGDPRRYALPKVEQYGVVRLRPEGAELVPYDITGAYDAFRAALTIWHWLEGAAKSAVGQPIGPALLNFPREAIA